MRDGFSSLPRKAALALEEESGVKAVPDSVTEIRLACMSGEWATVLSKLPLVPLREDIAPHLPRRLVLEEQFVETLAAGALRPALSILREGIAPMAPSVRLRLWAAAAGSALP